MTYGRDAWNEVFYIMERKKDAVDYVGSSFNSVSHVDMPPQCASSAVFKHTPDSKGVQIPDYFKKEVCRVAVNTDKWEAEDSEAKRKQTAASEQLLFTDEYHL